MIFKLLKFTFLLKQYTNISSVFKMNFTYFDVRCQNPLV